ncbi:MAG TPA: FAD-binding oxidoreductase [Patescibacteria group bacterium]|nr:FAD-binding oxidoreductase [Patescibacteria group bacterium]
MAMKTELEQALKKLLGERATTDLFERRCYERDLAPVPDFLVKPLADTLPDIVVRPQNTEEVASVMELAARHRCPVTARAGGSTVYFNAICTQRGILADVNGLNQLLEVNREQTRVRVGAGISWYQLERELKRYGLAARSYPSSAPAATVGGWLAMMGYGLGSLKYGPLVEQVLTARTVLPDGHIRDLTKTSEPPLDWLAGSEGTLGLITEVELLVRKAPAYEWHGLAAFAAPASMQQFIETVVSGDAVPFNLHFSDPACNALRHRLGLAGEREAQLYTVAFDADGETAEVAAARRNYERACQVTGAGDLREGAAEEWENRFFSLILKREGPSLLGAEIWLPLAHLAEYLQAVDAFACRERLAVKTYGHVVTARQAMVMSLFGADERDTLGYLQGLAFVKKLHDVGARYGGAPYGIGLWNTPYFQRYYDTAEWQERKRRKKMLDPDNVMNPGKVYQVPLLLQPAVFNTGMDLLAASSRVCRGKLGRKPG